MPLALVLSSHVASSRVGGFAQALALSQFKIDPVFVPTVLFGRHPGWGPPGGAAVAADTFQGVLDGVEDNGHFSRLDLVITGYFADADQIGLAAAAIDAAREAERDPNAATPALRVVVDPVIGDADSGLYVKPEVAEAVAAELIPRADLVAPNAWELAWLSREPVEDAASAVEAARRLDKPVLVSSIPRRDDIGVVYAGGGEAWMAFHPRLASVPKGTGDLLTALFAAALVEDQPPAHALARAVGGLVETLVAAEAWSAPELPIVGVGSRLKLASALVKVERLG